MTMHSSCIPRVSVLVHSRNKYDECNDNKRPLEAYCTAEMGPIDPAFTITPRYLVWWMNQLVRPGFDGGAGGTAN